MDRQLDFIIIGAQKAGTTSLHKYLNANPNIFMPPEKEAVFFVDEKRINLGFEWYWEEFFGAARNIQFCGKATPHYSGYPNAAKRISKLFPSVKLIYLIRDPIERAYSQYKMNVKRGLEGRLFSDVAHDLLENPVDWHDEITEVNSYLLWGKYCDVIKDYLSYFPSDQLLIVSSDELSSNSQGSLKRIYAYLGLEYFDSEIYSKKFHQGGRRKFLLLDKIKNIAILKRIWRYIMPYKFRRRTGFWLDQWNTKTDTSSVVPALDDGLHRKLRDFYKNEYDFMNGPSDFKL